MIHALPLSAILHTVNTKGVSMFKKTIIAGLTAAALGAGLAPAQAADAPAPEHTLTGNIGFYNVDDNGDPEPQTRSTFISGLSGAEGAAIDPVTGDFLFGTYGSGNRIIRVVGFPPPDNCPCDWNNVGCLNSQDFFDFLTDFFALARVPRPDTKVNLGCGRPGGAMKVALDRAAIDHGLNGIAYPADGMVAYAKQQGLEPEFFEYCCSLTWANA